MKFCFYASKRTVNLKRITHVVDDVFEKTDIHHLDNSVLFVQDQNKERFFYNQGNKYGYLCGYVRNFSLSTKAELTEHNKSLFSELFVTNWPLSNDFTGTFSAIAIDNEQLIIANDLIGIYPIYYYINNYELIVCSSLIALGGLINEKFDDIGVVQCITGPDYCNFGKRTIIANVSRLLPGEFLKFSLNTFSIEIKKYDNTLYQQIENFDLKRAAEKITVMSKKEYEIATRFEKNLIIAQSGGFDSRLMLGSIPNDKDISCITYGNNEHYETKIAKKCSKIKRADFTNFPIIPSLLFPDIKLFSEYTKRTGATAVNFVWLSILENSDDNSQNIPLLLGDMCESIMGRNIKPLKELKVSEIWKLFLHKKIRLRHSTLETTDIWVKRKTDRMINSMLKNLDRNRPYFDLDQTIIRNSVNMSKDEIINGCKKDLYEIFDLINKHELKYVELLDELFSWYTHGRISMSNQILLANSKYYCISPSMSIESLRTVSNIDPSLRIYGRLMQFIFKSTKELSKFAKLPTPTSPYIPVSWPLPFTFGMHWMRRRVDIGLARRKMRWKNPKLRSRMINSTNLSEMYNSEIPEKTVSTWFKPNYLGKLAGDCVEIVKRRKNGDSWPLTPTDFTSIASTNVQMDIITQLRTKK